jgi:hypothetical protein
MSTLDRSTTTEAPVGRSWFRTKSDFILVPAEYTESTRWKRHRCRSPLSKAVQEIEIWSQPSLDLYNTQPVWNLKDLLINKSNDAREALSQFLGMVVETSYDFCWPAADPGGEVKWRKHGWKHICYDDIRFFWSDYKQEPSIYRAEALGTALDIKTLFRAAADGDPQSVGRVWSLFPCPSEHDEIMEEFFSSDDRPKAIPDPAAVASRLVNAIFRSPNSDEAALSRIALKTLVSRSALKGVRTDKGRPKIMVSPSSLGLMLKMGRCLAAQVRQVSSFLEAHRVKDRGCFEKIQRAYPWIRKDIDLVHICNLNPSKAAAQIVSGIVEISPSAIEKIKIPLSAR